MCREGKNLECIDKLYAENVISKKMPRVPYGEEVTRRKKFEKKVSNG